MADPRNSPDEAAATHDEFQRTLAAVHTLPEMDRTVLLLRAEEALSYPFLISPYGRKNLLADPGVAADYAHLRRARRGLLARLWSNSLSCQHPLKTTDR
jgi:hypothetical protein